MHDRKWRRELDLPGNEKLKKFFHEYFRTVKFFETTILFTRYKPQNLDATSDMSLRDFLKAYAFADYE